jgi:hypothetical protein
MLEQLQQSMAEEALAKGMDSELETELVFTSPADKIFPCEYWEYSVANHYPSPDTAIHVPPGF